MDAMKMIQTQIEGIKLDIKYDNERLNEMVERFKEKAQRYTPIDIVLWDVGTDHKRITEIYDKIKNENELLQRLQYILDRVDETSTNA